MEYKKYHILQKEIEKDHREKLISTNLYQQTKEVLDIINNHKFKTESLKNRCLENTWNILRLNRNYGFRFDLAPSLIKKEPFLHYLTRDRRKDINDHAIYNEHHLIIGENYYALQNLICSGMSGKINMIYLDPPYNTKEIQSYADKFGRDGWLSMMKERLELARILLAEDGIIFVSIDDHEQAYLKILMDDIFGEKNFLVTIIRKTRSVLNRLINNVNINHEYCLVYLKNKAHKFNAHGEKKDFKGYTNPDNDRKGPWKSNDPSIGLALKGSQQNIFPIENPYTHQIDKPPKNCHWRFTKAKLQEHLESGKVIFRKSIENNKRGFIY